MFQSLRQRLSRRGLAASLVVIAVLLGGVAASLGVSGSRALAAQPALPEVLVYKTPTCGCCGKWIAHLRANGFTVRAIDLEDLSPIRSDWKVPPKLASCHTAKVGGYVVEGHVPAADIRRLLKTRPRVDGLSVPGMPVGSPGMEQGNVVEPYDVLAFNAAGETRVFARH
ncbi:MAG: DUF411 domain-containing protein [Steroidobacteraceae bacterium]|nr:DUF411 domain-containing protein [Steroidobacteraceae bacterium]